MLGLFYIWTGIDMANYPTDERIIEEGLEVLSQENILGRDCKSSWNTS